MADVIKLNDNECKKSNLNTNPSRTNRSTLKMNKPIKAYEIPIVSDNRFNSINQDDENLIDQNNFILSLIQNSRKKTKNYADENMNVISMLKKHHRQNMFISKTEKDKSNIHDSTIHSIKDFDISNRTLQSPQNPDSYNISKIKKCSKTNPSGGSSQLKTLGIYKVY